MKNFIKRIFLFICFLAFSYSICIFIFGSIFPQHMSKNLKYPLCGPGHLNRRMQDLKSYGNIDVLFLGSSHTYRGFDTRIFMKHGIKSFNLGSSGQTPFQTEILLERYLNLLKPKLVVYEVFPDNFSSDGVESALDLIANDKIDYLTIKMALYLNHIKVYNALIYKIIRGLFSLDDNSNEPIRKDKDTYVKGGFVEKELSYFDNKGGYSSKKWELADYQKEAFERILKKLQKVKINVILVQAPVTKEYYNCHSNKAQIDYYFSSLADYYNFNYILKLSSITSFYDSHHLNQNGVEIFNKLLIYIIQNNKYL